MSDGLEKDLHSTMVLFKFSAKLPKMLIFRFTFHYGPIQIQLMRMLEMLLHYLHSTMVLFKLIMSYHFYLSTAYLHSTMVLFKSVAIAIQ